MRKNELKNLKTKQKKELRKMIDEKKRDLTKSLSELKAGREKNFKKPKSIRRDIAQILTVVREKELMEKTSVGRGGELDKKPATRSAQRSSLKAGQKT
jgi:ribosomal protein L29